MVFGITIAWASGCGRHTSIVILESGQNDSGMGQNPEGTLVLGFGRTKIILCVLCQAVEDLLLEGGGVSLSPSPFPSPVCVCVCVCVHVCILGVFFGGYISWIKLKIERLVNHCDPLCCSCFAS